MPAYISLQGNIGIEWFEFRLFSCVRKLCSIRPVSQRSIIYIVCFYYLSDFFGCSKNSKGNSWVSQYQCKALVTKRMPQFTRCLSLQYDFYFSQWILSKTVAESRNVVDFDQITSSIKQRIASSERFLLPQNWSGIDNLILAEGLKNADVFDLRSFCMVRIMKVPHIACNSTSSWQQNNKLVWPANTNH